jgi:cellulose synthase/poly-beta-1,6-N-acetylglucosamine synthase-like glycosyltransferase
VVERIVMNIIAIVSIILTIPVLASSYYALFLFVGSLSYQKQSRINETKLANWPIVSVLVAIYNEKFVVEKTLDALKNLNYPRDRIQILIADDSTDETSAIIDEKVHEFEKLGIDIKVSRRKFRANFKSGALNSAAPLLKGDFVLLLDADSIVTPDILIEGVPLFNSKPDLAFVSFRVGHYNREQNLVSRLYALTLDLGDTQTKMGSSSVNVPFSFTGGFTLVSRNVLEQLGYWSDACITEDADLSSKIYCAGWRGTYLSDVRILSEDPVTLEVWKRQSARVAQGWGKILRQDWWKIVKAPKLSVPKRIALILAFLIPFSSLSWIILTFLSAIAIILGINSSQDSLFSSVSYTVIVTAPLAAYFGAAIYSLHLQRMMSWRNLLLVPLLSYSGNGMLAAISIGFVSGIWGKTGFFFRTPKSGQLVKKTENKYLQSVDWNRASIAEIGLAVVAISLSVIVFARGVWFLGLSMIGFGALTLKSMNFSRHIKKLTRNSPN